MKAMILAAGLGTRLQPFTLHHPKALAMVNGKSLLQRNIEYLQLYGINEVVVNVHHFADQIIRSIQEHNGWGSTIHISDETEVVLETGGGVLKAESFFEKESRFLVMNADILTNLNVHSFMEADLQNSKKDPNLIATLAVTDRKTSRNLLFNKEHRLVGWCNHNTNEYKWVTSPTDQYMPKAFSGIQIIHDNFYRYNKLVGKFSLIDAYLSTGEHTPIYAHDHSQDILLDVGKPENVEKAAMLFQ